ncbi:enoyl-CoA hydratase-related protein [Deltaproteobacteria bacterium TL4]
MTIQYEKDAQNIVTLSLDMENRSQNVLNDTLKDAFKTAIEQLTSEEKLAGVILTSSKRDFLAGADIDLFSNFTGTEDVMAWVTEFKGLFDISRGHGLLII